MAAWIGIVSVTAAASATKAAEEPFVFDAANSTQMHVGFKSTGGGKWALKEGKLHGDALNAAESTLVLSERDWQDVAVEVAVRFTGAKDPARWFAIVARDGGDSAPGVQFTVRQDTTRNNGLEIAGRRQPPEEGFRVLRVARTAQPTSWDRVHRVRLEVVGGWVYGYIDGKMVLRSCRGDEFAGRGQIALRLSGATVMIDRIQIAPLEAVKSAPPAIRTRPLVVAHRGFSFVAPENTLASYRLAIEAGADMAECDVYLTKDNVPVLMHDRTLERTAGHKGRLRDLTLAEARQLDAGKWKSPKFAGERIPTLVEALELTRGKLRFVIEIKEETIAADVVKAIASTKIDPQDLMIFSFYTRPVEEIARIEPRLPTTWLIDDPGLDQPAWREAVTQALRIRASAIGTSLTHVDPGFVRLAHECGLIVFVWTVNEPQDVEHLVRIGVDGIISDRPDMALEVVNRLAATK